MANSKAVEYSAAFSSYNPSLGRHISDAADPAHKKTAIQWFVFFLRIRLIA
jgi:hypothetical protein